MMKRFFIYGAGGHALVVMDAAELCGYEIDGFIDDFDHDAKRQIYGKQVYSPAVLQAGDTVFMGFGDNKMRQQIGTSLLAHNIEVATLLHPTAVISKYAKIGQGSFVGAHAIVDPGCEIGDFVILNKNSVVSHNTVIGSATHVCPGAMCAGGCSVGERCFLGIGTKLIARIKLADDVYVGGGAVIVEDFCTPGVLLYGVPARIHPRKNSK